MFFSNHSRSWLKSAVKSYHILLQVRAERCAFKMFYYWFLSCFIVRNYNLEKLLLLIRFITFSPASCLRKIRTAQKMCRAESSRIVRLIVRSKFEASCDKDLKFLLVLSFFVTWSFNLTYLS